MIDPTTGHLTPDDLDLWLEGTLPSSRLVHLEDCPDCFALAHAERRVVAWLGRLPLLAPSAGLSVRVMRAVTVPAPVARAPWRVLVRPSLLGPRWRAVAAGVGLAVTGAGLSVAWSLGHPDQLASLVSSLGNAAYRFGWTGLQALVANLAEQPWTGAARTLLSSPARAALTLGTGILLYASGLLAMRRLMTAPTNGVARAHS
ncbi:MAG: hypothetical protein ABJB33_10910 [Gemmatimonadota bacterium]